MTRRLAFALAAICLTATPVGATDPGQPCAVNATGLLDSHLGHQTGEIHGGPWAVPGGGDVTVTCEIEIGNADCYDTAYGYRVTSDPLPHVGVLAPWPVEFWNPYQQPVYLGTTISWSGGARQVDFDAAKPGAQCAVLSWGNEG